jgi:hypothetical protein
VPPQAAATSHLKEREHQLTGWAVAPHPAHHAFPAASSASPDARTVEWVVASQRAMACQATCQSRDCSEGFCYNVWNNMVHV